MGLGDLSIRHDRDVRISVARLFDNTPAEMRKESLSTRREEIKCAKTAFRWLADDMLRECTTDAPPPLCRSDENAGKPRGVVGRISISWCMSMAEPSSSAPDEAMKVMGNSRRPERSRSKRIRLATESPGRRYAHSRKCHSARVGTNSGRSARRSICTLCVHATDPTRDPVHF